ncbi:hypothetical protein AWRI1631_80700 [Saccharomyces cerevisiae AWRI1631]|uniref:Uncharacterized protein n=1 Tax=Saccharomyces cerevisiae (strain AWRI1631) TaxID=545124 RepID=B5VJU9_YEAS6|nr:hypothetical protein AWRI1631_80700 [Saccharomyces cerevisiae AWRI1631]
MNQKNLQQKRVNKRQRKRAWLKTLPLEGQMKVHRMMKRKK